MYKTIWAVSAVMLMSVAAGAAPTGPKAAAKHAAALVCPVTGEKIASVKDAVGHSVYKGKTYYFCCPACKPMFDADPTKYVKPAAVSK